MDDFSIVWDDLFDAVAESVERAQWWRAARGHPHGQGLECGAEMLQVRAQVRQHEGEGRHQRAHAIAVVIAGGQWPRERLGQCGIELPTYECQRCKIPGVTETLWHRCWECPATKALPEAKATEYPALWLRGLDSADALDLIPEPMDWQDAAAATV